MLKNDGKNRPDRKLDGIAQIEKENYTEIPLGEVRLRRRHYIYFVNGRELDGHQTPAACGIWAVRRKLRHMYVLRMPGISENDWYRLSDQEMRVLIATGANIDPGRDKSYALREALFCEDIVNLQVYMNLARANCLVRDIDNNLQYIPAGAYPGPLPIPGHSLVVDGVRFW